MERLPNMASISMLRNNYKGVFAQLTDGPVMIASRNQPAGVLISPEWWDRIVERLEDQDALIDGLQAALNLAHGEDELIDADISHLEKRAGLAIPA